MNEQFLLTSRIPRRTLLRQVAGGTALAVIGTAPASALMAQDAEQGEPQTGGVLRFGLQGDVTSFDPQIHTTRSLDTVRRQVYSGLFKLTRSDAGIEPVEDLVESWEQESDTEYLFHIFPDVQFHDGSVLTAEDVKYSFERMMDPEAGAFLYNTLTSSVESIEAVDLVSVRFTLTSPMSSFLTVLADEAAIVVSQAWIESGADIQADMMGTGPFRFVERQPNISIKLERHDAYFRPGLPYLDGIDFLPYPDDTARTTALRTGDIDFLDYAPPRYLESLENEGFTVHSDRDSAGMWLSFNVTSPPFDNPVFRQAISWSIDRQAILDNAFFGRGELMTGGPIPPSNWAYSGMEDTYGYDPDRARALLTESGVDTSQEISFVAINTIDFHRASAEIAMANLVEIGLNINLELLDLPTSNARRSNAQYQMYMQGSITAGDPDTWMRDFIGTGGPYNFGLFSDKAFDDLLDQARAIVDPEQRRALYQEAEARALELAPYAFLIRREQGEATAEHVKGYQHIAGTASSSGVPGTWLSS